MFHLQSIVITRYKLHYFDKQLKETSAIIVSLIHS